MKRYNFSHLLLFVLSLLLPCSLFAGADGKDAAVRVNDAVITSAEVESAIDTYVPPGAYHRDLGMQKRKEYRKPAIEMLIERELLFQEAAVRGITASEDEVSSALEDVTKQFRKKGDFEQALKNTGISLKEYREVLKRNKIIDKLLKAEVEDKARVTDEEIEAYYRENKEKFLRPEAFKAWHILVKVPPEATDAERAEKRSQAEALLKRIEAGEDFSEIAYQQSEDDYRVKGGDLGWVHKGRLEPALDEALATLNSGEIRLVETIYGYHILKLEAKKAAEQLGFSDVRESLKKEMETTRRQANKERLMDSLRKKARIEINITE